MFICSICGNSFDDAFLNEHHKIPQAFGGGDTRDNKRKLCAGCHQTLHRLAEHYLNPHKSGLVKDLATKYCFENCSNPSKSLPILLDLAKCAYEYELKINRGQLKLNPWSEKVVSMVIPLKFKSYFEQVCKRRVVYNKKGSMQSVLEDYILRSVMKEFPNLRKDVQEYINLKSK